MDIIGLVLVAFAIYLLFLFIVHVFIPFILPACGVILALIGAAGAVAGTGYAVMNYIAAVRENINFLDWTWPRGDEPAKRSYFFGPGYVQLIGTIKKAFELNVRSTETVKDTEEAITGESDGVVGVLRMLTGKIYLVMGYSFIYLAGTSLCAVCGLIHAGITTIVMILSYIIFTVLWAVDRIYLLKNKIFSDCPVCKNRFLIPWYGCPDCGRIHKKLVPGPYGILKHKCICSSRLPSTFLNGRSDLKAFCPCCGAPLVTSGARPIVFQLVGGSQAGKSVFLSAYFHEQLEKLGKNPNLSVEIPDQYRPFFDEMERWYNGGKVPPTPDRNSQMYPLLISSTLGITRQLSIYDIAGELFDGNNSEGVIVQQQFHYCNGILFLLDPFSSGSLRENRKEAGEDLTEFSALSSETVSENFINYMISTGSGRAADRISTPIAVLIAKADMTEVRREIGLVKINTVYRNHPELYSSLEEARDSECRKFLIKIGLGATVDNLETAFSNLHYFPVSAMGHRYDGSGYEPWGVTEALDWMLPLADRELSELIRPSEAACS